MIITTITITGFHSGDTDATEKQQRTWEETIPSQMAQAEIPLLQKRSSLGIPSRLAVAPVAMIMLLVFTCPNTDSFRSPQSPLWL